MKIAFIINSLKGGGAERVLQILSAYLAKGGYDIHIILLEKEKLAYDIDERINIITLKTSILAKGNGKIIFIPFQSFELYKTLKELQIDYAISFLVRANLVFSFTKIFSNRRVVISQRNYTEREYGGKSFKNRIMNFLIKKFYKKADSIVVISEGIKESLVRYYQLPEEKIVKIYNPIDLNKAVTINTHKEEKLKINFSEDLFYFITIGRLIPQKDHQTLLYAFGKIHSEYPKSKLLILGEGAGRKNLESIIAKLHLEDSVSLVGFVKNPFDYLQRSDIFVLSSQYEGFGNVLVEAMALGLPVLSTDCPSGPDEILSNGKYGLLTQVGHSDELALAMKKMLDKNKQKEYKMKSLERAKDFDVTIIAEQYLNILQNNFVED